MPPAWLVTILTRAAEMGSVIPASAEDTIASSPTSLPGTTRPGSGLHYTGFARSYFHSPRASSGEASPSPVLSETPSD